MAAKQAGASLNISIHALREERDTAIVTGCSSDRNFNPRAPRGARLRPAALVALRSGISIHALREERDPRSGNHFGGDWNFNPRAPRGARPKHKPPVEAVKSISIHALREERDLLPTH